MSRLPSRPRTRSPLEPKGFWLFSVLQSAALIVVSYVVGVFVYLVLIRVSELPHGPLWDESFRAPLAFVLIIGATIVIMIPYFNREWDRGLRMFSIFTALFLLAFASLSTSGIFNPQVPLDLLAKYAIVPLRHFLRF